MAHSDDRSQAAEAPVACANCGERLSGSFCYRCGQRVRRGSDYSIRHFAAHALHELVHFDNKFLRSMKQLLLRPGQLTNEYFAGRRQLYMQPLAMFVFLNFLFFIFKWKGVFQYRLKSFSASRVAGEVAERLAASGLRYDVFEATFDTSMKFQQKGYIIALVPLFALAVQFVSIRQRRYFMEHLVFALHFFSFLLVHMALFPLFLWGVGKLINLGAAGDDVLVSGTMIVCTAYLFVALRRVYRLGVTAGFLKAALLSFTVLVLVAVVYRYGLFYLVISSM